MERHRFLCSWFRAHPWILRPDIRRNQLSNRTRALRSRPVRVLHIGPERALAHGLGLSDNEHVDYVTGDFEVTPTATASGFVEHRIDVQAIPFPAEHFDVVLILHVLEHVPNVSRALAELFRVMKPGAVAIIAVPDGRQHATTREDTGGNMTAAERLEAFGQVDHVRRFGRDVDQILAAPGFAVKRIEIGKWYASRPEAHRPYAFRNEEYDPANEFYYTEAVHVVRRPCDRSRLTSQAFYTSVFCRIPTGSRT